jgi:hypothetical protein
VVKGTGCGIGRQSASHSSFMILKQEWTLQRFLSPNQEITSLGFCVVNRRKHLLHESQNQRQPKLTPNRTFP